MTKTSAVLFSEPYEAAGMRAEEVYRELLPPLCRVARENRRGVIVKLHPFESHSQRQRIIQDILAPEDRELITVLDGPLTDQLISRTWFGITVESTTAIDCRQNGICCFLCGWLSLSPYEYVLQYARFEVGEVLQEARQIEEIPQRVAKVQARGMRTDLQGAGDPAILKQWLTGSRDLLGSRVAP